MKTVWAVLVWSVTLANALALEVQITCPCSSKPIFHQNVSRAQTKTVGDLTIEVLEQFEIPFQGTSAGLNQIDGSPIGLDALEVISDNEMMAYGWCFEVDGKVPEVLASEFPLNDKIKVIHWFYGYAHYINGKWIAQCLKSHQRRSPFICSKKL